MAKQSKNPWVAAILNFILSGLGYVYSGKRIGFGVGLIIADLMLYTVSLGNLPPILLVYFFIIGVLFGYDGYKTAEEANKRK